MAAVGTTSSAKAKTNRTRSTSHASAENGCVNDAISPVKVASTYVSAIPLTPTIVSRAAYVRTR
jgi:hypothetical protein